MSPAANRLRSLVAPVEPVKLLTPEDLPSKGIKYAASQLRKKIKRKEFPEPKFLSPRKRVWPEHVIDAWIASKLA